MISSYDRKKETDRNNTIWRGNRALKCKVMVFLYQLKHNADRKSQFTGGEEKMLDDIKMKIQDFAGGVCLEGT